MSVNALQSKIRKLKNPSMVALSPNPALVPEGYDGIVSYYQALLDALEGIVPAVRLSLSAYALSGESGLVMLRSLAEYAAAKGFYVVLDGPVMLSGEDAEYAAKLWQEGLHCDAMVIPGYAGSDVIRPFLPLCGKDKALFVVVRTGNKSAPELQDLLTGSRLVHSAAAGMVNRHGEQLTGKYGYSQVGVLMGAAGSASLRSVREKYPKLFFLIDGLDMTGANAKFCSLGFDKMGHGAVVCAGSSITGAWQKAEAGANPIGEAVEAANRMKKNLTRYITIL